MKKLRFTPNKTRVVYTSITENIGRRLPFTHYRQLGMTGIRDVYLLLSEQEIANAKVEKILSDVPESDLDIQMNAAQYGGINLHIINTHDRKTEAEKLEYFNQLEKIDHSPFCSTIIISDRNEPLSEIDNIRPVQYFTNNIWLSDVEWIMTAATQINESIYQSLKAVTMTKQQEKEFLKLRKSCFHVFEKYLLTRKLREKAEIELEKIRDEYTKDA